MSETTGTSSGAAEETGTTGLADGPGSADHGSLVFGGVATPPDASATADADHPGMPASGELGDDAGSLTTEEHP